MALAQLGPGGQHRRSAATADGGSGSPAPNGCGEYCASGANAPQGDSRRVVREPQGRTACGRGGWPLPCAALQPAKINGPRPPALRLEKVIEKNRLKWAFFASPCPPAQSNILMLARSDPCGGASSAGAASRDRLRRSAQCAPAAQPKSLPDLNYRAQIGAPSSGLLWPRPELSVPKSATFPPF